MTTKNKSECKCENSCSCHHPSDCECNNQCFIHGCSCPCHLGDTLKKQEETHTQCPKCLAYVPKSWEEGSHTCPPFLTPKVAKQEERNESFDCSLYHPVGNLCSNPGCTGGMGISTPKVDTSEKECRRFKNGTKVCYCGKCPSEDYPLPADFKKIKDMYTPHESEDWSEEDETREDIRFLVTQAWQEDKSVKSVTDEITEILKSFIRKERERVSSKSYQRGKEAILSPVVDTIHSEKDVNKHESEDWEIELWRYLNIKADDPLLEQKDALVKLAIDFIRQEKSKSYQRGREEVYNKRYEQGLIDGKRVYVQEFIALAVQEIEKLRMSPTVCEINDRGYGFNQGLDKAIEIINNVANLKK